MTSPSTAYLTLNDVAARLKVKPQWLTRWLRKNPLDCHGQPFFHCAGRIKLFTETGVERIYTALPAPEAAPCRLSFRLPEGQPVLVRPRHLSSGPTISKHGNC
jgi:hypothetical protein